MIYVIGIGPGAPSYGLLGSEEIYQKADYILGSERHLEILPAAYQEKGVVPPKKLAELAQLIESYPEDATILYLASGDPLIYGLGKWLSEKFKGRVVVQPGISSFQYLASKVFLPMNDAYLTSSHAKIPDFDFFSHHFLPPLHTLTNVKYDHHNDPFFLQIQIIFLSVFSFGSKHGQKLISYFLNEPHTNLEHD